jgi:hypothetical protein
VEKFPGQRILIGRLIFLALAWSVKSERMPDENTAKHTFIHFKEFLFFQSKEK